jgi:hypothetical protein
MTQVQDWFLVTLFLISVILYAYVTVKSATTTPSPDAQGVGGSVLTRGARMSNSDVQLPPVAPMWWDDMEGAYMVVLVVGAGVVELVLDTGSSQLSVKGTGCEWRTCTPLGCAVTSCPCGFATDGSPRTNCAEHYYQPTGPRLAPGERGAGISTQMTYGSQTDTVQHYLDTVHVPVPSSSLTCEQVIRTPHPSTLQDVMGAVGAQPKVRVGELVVHRVSHIDGTSSSNLLGLARPNGGSLEHGARVVLDNLLDDTQTWSVVLRPSGGWLALGPLPCFVNPHHVPMVQPKSFSNFITSFYIVNVVSMAVGPSLANLTQLKYVPKYCIVDTGTTSTYGSPRLGEALDAAGYREDAAGVLQLKLGSSSSPLTLNYTTDQLRDPDYPLHCVIEAWPGRTLDDYIHIFPDADGGVLLLGAIMMMDMYWEFNIAKKRIGVSDFRQ